MGNEDTVVGDSRVLQVGPIGEDRWPSEIRLHIPYGRLYGASTCVAPLVWLRACLWCCFLNGTDDFVQVIRDSIDSQSQKPCATEIESGYVVVCRHLPNKHTSDYNLILEGNYRLEGESQFQIRSNYHRELAYNVEHAIHHMALIKIGVKENAPYVQLPDDFGIASSTIRYKKQQPAV